MTFDSQPQAVVCPAVTVEGSDGAQHGGHDGVPVSAQLEDWYAIARARREERRAARRLAKGEA